MRWLLVALSACFTAEPPPVANVAPVRMVAHRVGTVWTGHYTCAQGDTAVRLTLERAGSEARAKFEFGPLVGNPSVPHGAYTLRGTAHEDPSGAFEVELEPDRWLEQPPGYVMVGVTAVSDADRTRLIGRITFDGCGTIAVERSSG